MRVCSFRNINLLSNKMEWGDFSEMQVYDRYLLVVFQKPCLLSYNGEDYFPIPPGSIILYEPNVFHAYKSSEENFLNSFALFNVDHEYFSGFSFPFNEVFTVSEKYAEIVVKSLDEICYLLNTDVLPEKKKEIPEKLDWVFDIINKAYLESTKSSAPQNTMLRNFSEIRRKMYENPVEYTVKRMAELSDYSKEYFNIRYKQFFGISPCQDRKRQIVNVIKNYLQTTDHSLEKIAELCNLQSVPYLIHLFKSEEKITPHQYKLKHRT